MSWISCKLSWVKFDKFDKLNSKFDEFDMLNSKLNELDKL